MVAAGAADDSDIRSQPDHLPLVAAAGVTLLEAHDITQPDFRDHAQPFIPSRMWLISSRRVWQTARAACAKSLPWDA